MIQSEQQSGAIVAASFFGMIIGVAKWVVILLIAREVVDVVRIFAVAMTK